MDKLTVAFSSRALFDLSESHEVYVKDGVKAFRQHQIEREKDPLLEPGNAFGLVKKLQDLNDKLEEGQGEIELVLLSRNSSDTGLRVIHAIQHYDLRIPRAVFCAGTDPWPYANAIGCHLFLSLESEDVRHALEAGIPAATLVSPSANTSDHQIRFAFDGDAVLFNDDSERRFREEGLERFRAHEDENATNPMEPGPFKPFLEALQRFQDLFPADDCPIRTALVTARELNQMPRLVHTLRAWNIRIDEAMSLGGRPKKPALEAFGPDIFFDDNWDNCEEAASVTASAHVDSGVSNEEQQ